MKIKLKTVLLIDNNKENISISSSILDRYGIQYQVLNSEELNEIQNLKNIVLVIANEDLLTPNIREDIYLMEKPQNMLSMPLIILSQRESSELYCFNKLNCIDFIVTPFDPEILKYRMINSLKATWPLISNDMLLRGAYYEDFNLNYKGISVNPLTLVSYFNGDRIFLTERESRELILMFNSARLRFEPSEFGDFKSMSHFVKRLNSFTLNNFFHIEKKFDLIYQINFK